MPEIRELLTCKRILSLMVVLGFMIDCILRMNISLAIVEMVEKNGTNSTGNRFDWDEYQKNDILGCFTWGFLISSLPGGRLSEIYGPRKVMGYAMFIASVLTLLTPAACYLHYYCIIALRVCLGLVLGVLWPSIPPLTVNWVAPTDSAKFMAHTAAFPLGGALILPPCGYLIAYYGWSSVFFLTGSIGLIWTAFWFYLIYDSPKQHPRISKKERKDLDKKIRPSLRLHKSNEKTPWTQILTSKAVWAIVLSDICFQFDTALMLIEIPSYMYQVLGYDIKQNGVLSSLPCFSIYLIAQIVTYLADKLQKSKKISTGVIRKIFQTIAFGSCAVFFLIQSLWGYDRIVSIIVFTLFPAFLTATIASFIPNCIDLSPVYSGTIFGTAETVSALSGYMLTKLVALLTNESPNAFEQWRYIFWIMIVLNVITVLVFNIFGSGSVQDWNPKSNEMEMDKIEPESLK